MPLCAMRLVVCVSWRFVRHETRFRVYPSSPTVVQRALIDAFVRHETRSVPLVLLYDLCRSRGHSSEVIHTNRRHLCFWGFFFFVDFVDIPVRRFTLTLLLLQSGLRLDPYPQRSFHTIGAPSFTVS